MAHNKLIVNKNGKWVKLAKKGWKLNKSQEEINKGE
jgi:hypothetical protein